MYYVVVRQASASASSTDEYLLNIYQVASRTSPISSLTTTPALVSHVSTQHPASVFTLTHPSGGGSQPSVIGSLHWFPPYPSSPAWLPLLPWPYFYHLPPSAELGSQSAGNHYRMSGSLSSPSRSLYTNHAPYHFASARLSKIGAKCVQQFP
jgi:hypothetical protein